MANAIVPVIHGVANVDRDEFTARVNHLQELLDGPWQLVPVFWNPLGASVVGIEDTYPVPGERSTRGPDDGPSAIDVAGGLSLLGPGDEGVSAGSVETRADSDAAKIELVASGATTRAIAHPGVAVRSEAATVDIRQAIAEEWPKLRHLRYVDDPIVLRQVGAIVGAAVGQATDTGEQTRGVVDDIKGIAKQVLSGADDLVGAVLGRVGEQVHYALRSALTPGFAKGLGDVFVYQHHRPAIAVMVVETIRAHGATLGTEGNRISIIGHSLGGVIAFDLATRSHDPLYLDALVTFGSQSSILHVLDPRGGLIDPYAPPQSTALPATIRHWTSLWEAWDPLAFAATPVFGPADKVEDVRIPHRSSAGLWSHSTYWDQDDAVAAMRTALEAASH